MGNEIQQLHLQLEKNIMVSWQIWLRGTFFKTLQKKIDILSWI